MCEKEIILQHFNRISTSYDENNKKLYWKLSDDLLWEIIKKHIPKYKPITILELGAGTGEWAYKILNEFNNVNYVLVDFSDNMLKQANKKLIKFRERVKIINADINNLKINEKFDVVLNIYVLPFFEDTEKLIKFVSSYLKVGGISISATENYYNGLALNILKGDVGEVKKMIKNHNGTLSPKVPKISFDKLNELECIYKNYNLNTIFKCGYPVVSLIGVEEVLTSNKNSISKILLDDYNYIFEIEKQYIQDESLINRGKYICIVGEKYEENSNIKRKKHWRK